MVQALVGRMLLACNWLLSVATVAAVLPDHAQACHEWQHSRVIQCPLAVTRASGGPAGLRMLQVATSSVSIHSYIACKSTRPTQGDNPQGFHDRVTSGEEPHCSLHVPKPWYGATESATSAADQVAASSAECECGVRGSTACMH